MSGAIKQFHKDAQGYSFRFPSNSPLMARDFTFGVATSSYQIEGAVHADGRLESIWDRFCKTPGKVKNGDNGDLACDHYNLWQSDLDLLADLGVDAYRLSFSWVRIVKEDGTLNPKGVDFYRRLLERLQQLGIRPFVTLYHWDLPQHLEDRGGWLNRDCAYRFAEYADRITRELGGLCYSIATLNEPWCSAFLGYGAGTHAPGRTGQRNAKQAGHHLLLGHGLAMQALRANAPESKLGIVLNMGPTTPLSQRYDDRIAATIVEASGNNWFLEPLVEGTYPDIINRIKPHEQPLVLEGDMQLIATPLDFIGINYYTRTICAYDKEELTKLCKNDHAEHTNFGWEIYPQGLTDVLLGIHQQYNLPELIVTENGASGADKVVNGEVHDEQRCRYFDFHLQAVNEAIKQGVRITGYFAWSMLDNFEWAEGYSKRFGLYHVDFSTQQRTPKSSAKAFREFLAKRKALRA